SCPLSGRSSTYRPVQIPEAGSIRGISHVDSHVEHGALRHNETRTVGWIGNERLKLVILHCDRCGLSGRTVCSIIDHKKTGPCSLERLLGVASLCFCISHRKYLFLSSHFHFFFHSYKLIFCK